MRVLPNIVKGYLSPLDAPLLFTTLYRQELPPPSPSPPLVSRSIILPCVFSDGFLSRSRFNVTGRAKWDARAACRGLAPIEAMRQYMDKLETLIPNETE